MGSIDQWKNHRLVIQMSWIRIQAVLVFSCVYQELNKRLIKTQ